MSSRTSPPAIGEAYDGIPHGQGIGVVIEVERDPCGGWTRVRVRDASGCLPVPPPDRPDGPSEQWTLPVAEVWLDRGTWERLAPRVLRRDPDGTEPTSELPRATARSRPRSRFRGGR